jgi:hypothetical protein
MSRIQAAEEAEEVQEIHEAQIAEDIPGGEDASMDYSYTFVAAFSGWHYRHVFVCSRQDGYIDVLKVNYDRASSRKSPSTYSAFFYSLSR